MDNNNDNKPKKGNHSPEFYAEMGKRSAAKRKIKRDKIRDFISDLLEDNIDQVKEDLKELSAKDRIRAYTDLIKYVVPTATTIEIEDENGENVAKQILGMNIK